MVESTLFKTEDLSDVMVVTPVRNMGEFRLADSITPAFEQLVELTDDKNVVFDLSETDYFGSSTIGLFIHFAKHVHSQNRKIAFCGFSTHEKQIVGITHVNQFFDVRESLASAIALVRGRKPEEKPNEWSDDEPKR